MPTIRLPADLPARALRRIAAELAAAARSAEFAAGDADAKAAEATQRRERVAAALKARRSEAERRRATIALAIVRAACTASVAQSVGVSVRTVERVREAMVARISGDARG